ncbi:hypothetical protein Dimus_006336 [Dionaea muscipula]
MLHNLSASSTVEKLKNQLIYAATGHDFPSTTGPVFSVSHHVIGHENIRLRQVSCTYQYFCTGKCSLGRSPYLQLQVGFRRVGYAYPPLPRNNAPITPVSHISPPLVHQPSTSPVLLKIALLHYTGANANASSMISKQQFSPSKESPI